MSILAALLSLVKGMAAQVGSLLVDHVPPVVWYALAGLIAGFGLGGYAVHSYYNQDLAAGATPTITRAERVDPSKIPADVWKNLAIGYSLSADEADTTQIVVPSYFFEDDGGGNALPEVVYRGDFSAPKVTLRQYPFVTVDLQGGTRPSIDVGPEEVVLYANAPGGRPLTYTYSVPSPSRSVFLDVQLGASWWPPLAPERIRLGGALLGGFRWKRGAVRAGPGLTPEGLAVRVQSSYRVFSWSF